MDENWEYFILDQGCEKALQLWIKFIDGYCEQKWDHMYYMNFDTQS